MAKEREEQQVVLVAARGLAVPTPRPPYRPRVMLCQVSAKKRFILQFLSLCFHFLKHGHFSQAVGGREHDGRLLQVNASGPHCVRLATGHVRRVPSGERLFELQRNLTYIRTKARPAEQKPFTPDSSPRQTHAPLRRRRRRSRVPSIV